MKHIVIVPDGMADEPLDELNGKTPLEVARTVNMNHLAKNGMTGLLKTIPDKFPPGSDIGNLAMMGYNPATCFSGRAALEAANLGIHLAPDEIVFRCNFVTIENKKMADYSAGHITTEEANQLIRALNDEMADETLRFYAGKSYRHLLKLKVSNLKAYAEMECTPPHDILGKEIEKYLPQGKQAALLLRYMERSKKILAEHKVNQVRVDLKENPANMIWLWGQGTKPNLPSFKSKFGVEGAIISAVDLVNGIGKLAGLEVLSVPGITGYYDTNYAGKAEYAIKSLKTKDFVFIHIEGPDEAGHNGDMKAKIACIEHIDREIVGPIINHFDKSAPFRILIAPDHPTPVKKRTHTREPVPFILYGKDVPAEGAAGYSEKIAKEIGVRFKSGEAIVEQLMKKY